MRLARLTGLEVIHSVALCVRKRCGDGQAHNRMPKGWRIGAPMATIFISLRGQAPHRAQQILADGTNPCKSSPPAQVLAKGSAGFEAALRWMRRVAITRGRRIRAGNQIRCNKVQNVCVEH